jgi:hypothetical protein
VKVSIKLLLLLNIIVVTVFIIISLSTTTTINNNNNLSKKLLTKKKVIGSSFNLYEYFIYKSKEIKNGKYLSIVHNPHSNKNHAISISIGQYSNNKETGLFVFQNMFYTTYRFTNNGKITMTMNVDKNCNIVAKCTFKDGKPYNGSYWLYAPGLHNTAGSITYFSDGKRIKEEITDEFGNNICNEKGNIVKIKEIKDF